MEFNCSAIVRLFWCCNFTNLCERSFRKTMDASKFLPIQFPGPLLVMLTCLCVASGSGSLPRGNNFAADRIRMAECLANNQNLSADLCGFRGISGRILAKCADPNPFLNIELSTQGPLGDEEYVNVTVNGVVVPNDSQWIGLISPSTADVGNCLATEILYVQTGDLESLPLLCHYPVKAQFLKNDPGYIPCANSRCEKEIAGKCSIWTCSGSLMFHVINIRTPVEFVMFGGGFDTPCIHRRSGPLQFANPRMPLYGHLSSVDSTATAMRLTWISGDNAVQSVQYGHGKSAYSIVTTFTQADMCNFALGSPAKDFGWHDPGYIHTALMTGLLPSQQYTYRYGSDAAGWSSPVKFSTPPAAGSRDVRFIVYGDMGKAPRDASEEHYIQPGSLGVIDAVTRKLDAQRVDSIYHIGDISYATGFLVEWDFFLRMIAPVASRVSYMTAIGNHERDYPDSNSTYETTDSGGECGVPYERYFPMPTAEQDKPWYSIEQGPVHFTVMSTEHPWMPTTEQYDWIRRDLAAVDRKRTPWVIFTGHRPMYSSGNAGLSELIMPNVDPQFPLAIEPLLINYQVDLVLWGHVHNYERTCSIYLNECITLPYKDLKGIDTYNYTNYTAPIHIIIGTGGFALDSFNDEHDPWSLVRISQYGYGHVHATSNILRFKFINSSTGRVEDRFNMIKNL